MPLMAADARWQLTAADGRLQLTGADPRLQLTAADGRWTRYVQVRTAGIPVRPPASGTTPRT